MEKENLHDETQIEEIRKLNVKKSPNSNGSAWWTIVTYIGTNNLVVDYDDSEE